VYPTLPLLVKTVGTTPGSFSNYDEIFDKNGTNYEQLLYQWPICNGAGDQIDFPRPILIDCCLKGQMLFRPSQYVTNITITLINKGIKPNNENMLPKLNIPLPYTPYTK